MNVAEVRWWGRDVGIGNRSGKDNDFWKRRLLILYGREEKEGLSAQTNQIISLM